MGNMEREIVRTVLATLGIVFPDHEKSVASLAEIVRKRAGQPLLPRNVYTHRKTRRFRLVLYLAKCLLIRSAFNFCCQGFNGSVSEADLREVFDRESALAYARSDMPSTVRILSRA